MTASSRSGSTGLAVRLGLAVASLALAVLLLIGFQAPQGGVVAGAARSVSGGSGTTTSGTSGSTTTSGGVAKNGTFDGTLVNMRYGSVQVEITVSGGKVTSVTALALPVGGRSSAISGYAGPILASEAVSAQSASIDLVSGATYTSEAYAQSLQSALDQAGI